MRRLLLLSVLSALSCAVATTVAAQLGGGGGGMGGPAPAPEEDDAEPIPDPEEIFEDLDAPVPEEAPEEYIGTASEDEGVSVPHTVCEGARIRRVRVLGNRRVAD